MVWLLFLALAATDPATGSDFRLDTESPERGAYRLQASETLNARVGELAAVLEASKCRQGCDYVVDHVAEEVELDRRDADGVVVSVSYTRIDSTLDASYFTVSRRRAEPGRFVLEFETADPEVVASWTTTEHRHDPLFHHQHGTWTLTEQFDAAGRFLRTEVRYEMEMRSDRFLVNLLPGRVLAGSADHVRTIFGYLRARQSHRFGPAR